VGQKVERTGLEWLSPLLTNKGKLRDKLRVKEVADMVGCSPAMAYELCHEGRLETISHGQHMLVLTRSVMIYLWENWSGRHTAHPAQITTFVLLLLGLLPTSALRAVQLACEQLITSRKQAESHLHLEAAKHQPRRADHPELFGDGLGREA
jgi:hypothetical protein